MRACNTCGISKEESQFIYSSRDKCYSGKCKQCSSKLSDLPIQDLEGEEWRRVKDHPEHFISNKGRVKSFTKSHPRLLKSSSLLVGYFRVCLYDRTYLVHRLVAAAFIGERPEGYQIDHIDGVKTNNCAENLEYVTPKENNRRARALGLIPAKQASRTLLDSTVKDIKLLIEEGVRFTEIVGRFGISAGVFYDIKRGRSYKWIQLNPPDNNLSIDEAISNDSNSIEGGVIN